MQQEGRFLGRLSLVSGAPGLPGARAERPGALPGVRRRPRLSPGGPESSRRVVSPLADGIAIVPAGESLGTDNQRATRCPVSPANRLPAPSGGANRDAFRQ